MKAKYVKLGCQHWIPSEVHYECIQELRLSTASRFFNAKKHRFALASSFLGILTARSSIEKKKKLKKIEGCGKSNKSYALQKV